MNLLLYHAWAKKDLPGCSCKCGGRFFSFFLTRFSQVRTVNNCLIFIQNIQLLLRKTTITKDLISRILATPMVKVAFRKLMQSCWEKRIYHSFCSKICLKISKSEQNLFLNESSEALFSLCIDFSHFSTAILIFGVAWQTAHVGAYSATIHLDFEVKWHILFFGWKFEIR